MKKNPIKLPNDPSYNIHVFYKGRLQSLIKIKKFHNVVKKIQPTLIIEQELTDQNYCTRNT